MTPPESSPSFHFFLLPKSISYHFLALAEDSSPTLCSNSWFLHWDSTRASLVCASSSSKFLSLCSELKDEVLSLHSILEPSLACGQRGRQGRRERRREREREREREIRMLCNDAYVYLHFQEFLIQFLLLLLMSVIQFLEQLLKSQIPCQPDRNKHYHN